MEEDVTQSEEKGSTKKFLIIGIVVAVVIAIFSFGGSVDTEEALASLDELIELDKDVSETLWEGDVESKEFDEMLDLLDEFVGGYAKEAKEHIKLAKSVDVDDEEEMQGFMARHDKIMELYADKDECKASSLGHISDILDEMEAKSSQIKAVEDAMQSTCDISRTLDVVEIESSRDTIEVANEYTEIDSSVIPSGYSFIAQRPTNGTVETVTLTVDEKERDATEVVTLEPVVGKKVTGTGDEKSIIASVLPTVNEIVSLWNDQAFNPSTIEEHLEESLKTKDSDLDEQSGAVSVAKDGSTASNLKTRYEQVLFNWRRFEDVEILSDKITFEDVSDSYRTTELGSTNHPFVMNVPVVASYIDNNKEMIIPLYYYSETDSWGAGLGTLDAFFNIASKQDIAASYSPTKIVYEESDTCVDSWGFKRADGIEPTYMSLMGNNDFYINAGANGPTQLFVKVEGKDTISEMPGRGYGKFHSYFTPALIEYFNTNKILSLTIKEFNNDKCKSEPDIKVTFFEENKVEEEE